MSHNVSNFDEDLAVIQTLDDEPNDVDGLSAQQLKAKFDQAALLLQKFLNEVLIPAHNGLDNDVNQRIDEVIEELKNVSEINAENLGAQNIALDKKGETTLADQYNTGELAPTVHGALGRILEMFLRKGGDTMTGDLSIEKLFPVFRLKSTQSGRTAEFNMGGDSYTSVYNRKDDKNYQGFYIPPETAGAVMQLVRCINGGRHVFNVIHTGNMEALNMAKVVAGSYTGTGETTKTLTFPFTPKLVYVATKVQGGAVGHLLVINGMEQGWNCFSDQNLTTGARATKLSWGEKSLTLLPKDPINSNERDTPEAAMNSSRYEYFYVAIG